MKQFLFLLILFNSFSLIAQTEDVKWLSFEELELALKEEPKKVFIHFYADWCRYCKKMENVVYTKSYIEKELASNYYAVKFNVESQDTIHFGGKDFINKNLGKKRLVYHEIPELLASRPNESIELPTLVFLDEEFNIEKRYFTYLSPKQFLSILKSE